MELAQSTSPWRQAASSPLTIIVVIVTTVFLYWASPILVPLALSILLAFLLNPLVTFLQRRRMPRTAAAFIVTIVAMAVIGAMAWLFVSQVIQLGEQLPEYERKITQRIDSIRENGKGSLLTKVQSFVDRVNRAMTQDQKGGPSKAPQPVVLVGQGSASLTPLFAALGPVLEPLATIGLVIVQLIYLLVDGENLRDRFLRLVGQGNMPVTTRAINEAGGRISRYLVAQFFLNAAFGVVVAVGLWLLGVPHAALWGFTAGFLRYVPYLGPWLAVIFPLMLSLMTSEGWGQPIGVLLIFGVFELLSNIVIEPIVYGKSIGISQSALIISIAFWAWLWGPMGMVLAAPITVCLAIMGKYVPGLKILDIVLGDASPLAPEARFYQRLLAKDEDSAFQIATTETEKLSLFQVFDQFLVPALSAARRDWTANRLNKETAESIWHLSAEIGEEIALVRSRAPKTEALQSDLDSSQVKILICAVRDGAEEAAIRLFQTSFTAAGVELEVAGSNRLASEITALAVDSNPAAVLLISLPPGGVSRARLLCKRLKQNLPELKLVVGRWGNDVLAEEDRKQLIEAGANTVAASMEETQEELLRFVKLARLTANSESSRLNRVVAPEAAALLNP